ncbi:MAG: hypothetical protein V3W20_10530, partial [Candidatus Neomarinimicrobiota bacterium]
MKYKIIKWIFLLLFIFVYSCEKNKINDNDLTDNEDTRKITILYTNDEHGWIEKSEYTNGAANMMGLWRDNEEY